MLNNPVMTDMWRATHSFGKSQFAYLFCLSLQALALILWWPDANIGTALSKQHAPGTLFATLIAVAFTICYQSVRCGAEEIIGANQQSIREWLLSTRLTIRTLVTGYLLGHFLQALHWLLLSMLIVLVAYAIGDSSLSALTLNLIAIFLMSYFYRLFGVGTYLLLGHYDDLVYYITRIMLFAAFIGAGLVIENASYWQIAQSSLSIGDTNLLTTPPSEFIEFLTMQITLVSLASGALALVFRYRRRLFDQITS